MSNSKTTITTGFALPSMVFIVFLIFKLAEIGKVATWSWWWVLMPLWMPIVIGAAVLIIWLIGLIIYSAIKR